MDSNYAVWNTIRMEKTMEIEEGEAFYRVSKNWYRVSKGDVVAGGVIYRGRVSFDEVYLE